MEQVLEYKAFDSKFSEELPTAELRIIERNNSLDSIKSFQATVLGAAAQALVERAGK